MTGQKPPLPADPRFQGATPEKLALALRKPKPPKMPKDDKADA